MPLVRMRFAAGDEDQYVRAFQVMEGEAADLTEPLTRIRDQIVHAIEDQFDSEGSHGLGSRWQPLNPSYAAWRREHYPAADRILSRTGLMRDELTHRGTRELSPRRLEVGINPGARYPANDGGESVEAVAEVHQGGKGKMPQRKIIALTLAERRQFDREFVEWFSAMRRRVIGGPR